MGRYAQGLPTGEISRMVIHHDCASSISDSLNSDHPDDQLQLSSRSIFSRHCGPKRFIAQMTDALENVQIPRIVKSQPLPIAAISGAPTIPPIHDKMFRHRLFKATPDEDLLGMNSVSIVVAMANISIDPTP